MVKHCSDAGFAVVVVGERGLACNLQFNGLYLQIPSQEAKGFVCFGTNGMYLLIPSQVLVHGNSKIFGRDDGCQSLVVQLILMAECLFLPRDGVTDAFSRVEDHVPALLL